uniref:SET domain-containing protein n=1 Tax=Steinernema glaseri TaxID=37863 RepID=A0A1I7XVW0_9BILA
MTTLYAWILLFIVFPLSHARGVPKTAVVIVGAPLFDAQKRQLALSLGVSEEVYGRPSHLPEAKAPFAVFGAPSLAALDENFVVVAESETNRTIVVASEAPAHMSLYELGLLHSILDSILGGVAVVELGDPSPQTESVAKNSAFCWARARFELPSPHRVLLCNGVDFDDLRPLLASVSSEVVLEAPSHGSVFPSFFASASPTKTHAKRVHRSRKTIQPHGHRKLQLLRHRRRYGKKIDKFAQRQARFHELSSREKKLACRYRKSCYRTGRLPQLGFYEAKLEDALASAKVVEEEEGAIDAEEIPELEVKVLCKYRPSCYAEIGLEMSEANQKKSGSLLSGRIAQKPREKRRRTLKEVAEIALRKVEAQQQQKREVPRAVVVEKKLNEIEERLRQKVACKYRKSCYETGRLPELEEPVKEDIWSRSFAKLGEKLFGEKEETAKEFEELDEADRKVYCKYRKSCYETGVVPEIQEEELFRYDDIVEMDEVPMQVRCKYRKSCYETGVVPESKAEKKKREDDDEETKKRKTMPMTLDHLRLLCKYRKSCYVEKAGLVEESEGEEEDEKTEKQEAVEEEVVPKKAPKTSKKPKKEAEEAPKQTKKEPEEKKESEAPKRGKSKKRPVEEPVAKEEAPKRGRKAAREEKKVDVEPMKKESAKKPSEGRGKEKKEVEVEQEITVEPVKKSSKKTKREPEEEETEVKEEVPVEPARKAPKKAKKVKHQEAEDSEEELKSSCRYRKSCYESGEVPEEGALSVSAVLEGAYAFFEELYAKAMAEETPRDESWEEKSFEQRRVDCRYRKSCYESGVLPELEKQTLKTVVVAFRETGGTLQQRCKYRKSCYEREKEERPKRRLKKVEPIIEEPKKEPKKQRHAKEQQKPVEKEKKAEEDEDAEEEKEQETKKKSKKKLRRPVDDDEENMKEIPRPEHRNLSTSAKLGCKYRTSCYGTGEHIVITASGKKVQLPDGHRCKNRSAIYFLSCRELLGLPPKERAPIGPNGRKLCRKKKITDSA